jgi:hypothetical protein
LNTFYKVHYQHSWWELAMRRDYFNDPWRAATMDPWGAATMDPWGLWKSAEFNGYKQGKSGRRKRRIRALNEGFNEGITSLKAPVLLFDVNCCHLGKHEL